MGVLFPKPLASNYPPQWEVLATAQATAAVVELRRYTLPRPGEMWEVDTAPVLGIVLPRAGGTKGEIQFDIRDGRRHRVGRLMLRPAGITMHSRGDGGILDILTCRFDIARFEVATGLRDWDTHRLTRCASIISPPIMALAERLRQEILSARLSSAIAIDAIVNLLLVELARAFEDLREPPLGGTALAPWQLARIEQCLRSSVGQWPTTLGLADLCGISRSHLSRSFAAVTGASLSRYAAGIRLERAQDMIRAGELPLAQIALELGFATASAFSAAFRRSTGVAPREFRKIGN